MNGPPTSWGVCPVCFWEDDAVQLRWPDSRHSRTFKPSDHATSGPRGRSARPTSMSRWTRDGGRSIRSATTSSPKPLNWPCGPMTVRSCTGGARAKRASGVAAAEMIGSLVRQGVSAARRVSVRGLPA
ncbi:MULTISPECIES: CPCC family cysteine-rich protein [unclassified Streptomyces]|uniref:CPCC family cysteine-rich protein n=1 Tax=unclassified Streptomyces TaxID=2593676 RepID=UPI003660569F